MPKRDSILKRFTFGFGPADTGYPFTVNLTTSRSLPSTISESTAKTGNFHSSRLL
jgi:hypothetical protein